MKKPSFLLLGIILICCTLKHEPPIKEKVKTDSIAIAENPDDKYYFRPFVKDSTNWLDGVERQLTVTYTTFGCYCASWITKDDFLASIPDIKIDKYFFIEPASDSLEKIQTKIDTHENYVIISGQFYIKKDFPANVYRDYEGEIKKARVFRYHKIKALKKK